MTNTKLREDDPNKKTPEGDSLHSFGLNTDYYTTIVDTLKAHALATLAKSATPPHNKGSKE